MRVAFVKMEGAGNDYVHVDAIGTPFPLDRCEEIARAWSDRHFGIGADGLIVLAKGSTSPLRMLMWNADGSRGAMCGNGLRCLARLAFEHGHVTARAFAVDTDAGPRRCELLDHGAVRTSMGEVRCGTPIDAVLGETSARIVPGDAGNPHAVIFVDDVERAPVTTVGAALQAHAAFPGGVNVEFVQVEAPDLLRQRTFERGSGETLACGTGAAVAVVAARASGRVHTGPVTVRLRGGDLRILGSGSSLAIEGPTRTVFRGEVELPDRFGRPSPFSTRSES